MTAKDNRTSTETTVDELDAMDIGRIITFNDLRSPTAVAGTLVMLTHNKLAEDQGFACYTLHMDGGVSYTFKSDHKVTIHKPGIYGPSNPVIGFHNVG